MKEAFSEASGNDFSEKKNQLENGLWCIFSWPT